MTTEEIKQVWDAKAWRLPEIAELLVVESAGDQPPVETNVFDDVERLEDMG
jgi:hypothetical protein